MDTERVFTSHDSGNESRVNPPFSSSSSSPVRHVCDVRGFRGLGPITENKEEKRRGRIPCCLVIVASYQDYSERGKVHNNIPSKSRSSPNRLPHLLKKRGGGGGEDNAPFLERSARLDISERTSNPLLPRKVRSPLCERIEQATDRSTVASIPSIRQGQPHLLETLKASVLFGFQFWSVEDQISLKICGFPQSTPQLQLVHLPPLPPSLQTCVHKGIVRRQNAQ